MKKVLITGAGGYIGRSVEKYISENHPGEFEFDFLSLRGDEWREKDFGGYDAVIHAAGIAHRKETKENAGEYYAVNRDLAVEVAEKAKRSGVAQFVFLSSMSVYGKNTGRITVDTVPNPKSNYGKSKLQAEEKISLLADGAFRVCILRPPMIYGKDCKGNYATLRRIALKLKIFPYVKNERSMLHIDNLCEFVRLIVINGESGLFFPQNDEYTVTSEMVKVIAAANGRKVRLVKGFGWAVKLMGLFTGKVKKAFGTLTYDKSMSEYVEPYAKTGVVDSVIKTEQG